MKTYYEKTWAEIKTECKHIFAWHSDSQISSKEKYSLIKTYFRYLYQNRR